MIYRLTRLGSQFVGLVLLFSALSKISDSAPSDIYLFYSNPSLKYFIAAIELVFGFLLVIRYQLFFVEMASAALFLVFGFVSLVFALNGESSCGCFGRIKVSPWATMIFDFSATLFLMVKVKMFANQNTSKITPFIEITKNPVVIGFLLFVIFIIGQMVYLQRGFESTILILRGRPISIHPQYTAIGGGNLNEGNTFRVKVSNNSSKIARVIGVSASCGCVFPVEEFPIEINPGDQKEIEIHTKFKGSPGAFLQQYTLYCESPSFSPVVGYFFGSVTTLNKEF